jgi:hypothetical protein
VGGTAGSQARIAIAAAMASAAIVGRCGERPPSPSPADTESQPAPATLPRAAADRPSWWPTSAPEVEGLDSATLAAVLAQLVASHIAARGLLMARDGNIVLDDEGPGIARYTLRSVMDREWLQLEAGSVTMAGRIGA